MNTKVQIVKRKTEGRKNEERREGRQRRNGDVKGEGGRMVKE